MTKVSRIPMSKKAKLDAIEEFWYALGYLNKSQVELFFQSFFSPTETLMFAKRLDVLKALHKKIEYQHIRASLKVTDTTIAKMSSILQRGDDAFIRTLDTLIRDEERRWQATLDSRKPHIRGKMIFQVRR